MEFLKENLEIVLLLVGTTMVFIIIFQLKLFVSIQNLARFFSEPNPREKSSIDFEQTNIPPSDQIEGHTSNRLDLSDSYHPKKAIDPGSGHQTSLSSDTHKAETCSTPINSPRVIPTNLGHKGKRGKVMNSNETNSDRPDSHNPGEENIPSLEQQPIPVPKSKSPDLNASPSGKEQQKPGSEPLNQASGQPESIIEGTAKKIHPSSNITSSKAIALNVPESRQLNSHLIEKAGDTDAEQFENLQEQAPDPTNTLEPHAIDVKEASTPNQELSKSSSEQNIHPEILPSSNGDGIVDATKELTQTLRNRYYQYSDILINFEKEFQVDKNRLDVARKRYFHWQSYVQKLLETYENDLLFEFTEILEKKRFHIVELKKMMIFPLTQNESENEKRVKGWVQNLSEEIEYLDIPKFSEALTGLNEVFVRRGTDGDYQLQESSLCVGMTPELRIFLKNFLNTLLIIYRQLRGKNFKEVFALFCGFLESDKKLHSPLQIPDIKKVMVKIFSEDPSLPLPLNPEHLDDLTKANYHQAQEVTDLADAIHKKYFEYLDKNLLRSLNNLKQTRANYFQTIGECFSEFQSELVSWGEIFESLINLLNQYLEEHLHIQVIPCKRGDPYDPDRNMPNGPVEMDDELGPHLIKSVDEDGYQYVHQASTFIVKPTRVTVTG